MPPLRFLLVAGTLLLAGCAAPPKMVTPPAPPAEPPGDMVVLLPDASGRSGSVVVGAAGGETVLDRPYAAAEVTSAGRVATRTLDPAEVRSRFGDALSAQPPRPVSLTLYFLEGKNELTPDSVTTLDRLKGLLAGWPAPEISIIGHTDTVGGAEANDALSLERAEVVRKMLVGMGIEEARITAVGRGERELLVPTADGVSEPKNRRVEVNVR